VYFYKDILKLDPFGRLGLTGASTRPLAHAAHDERAPDALPTIRRGDRGEAVALLQRFLMIKDDGIFGPKTDSVVRSFQTSAGLTRDGVVGRMTWAALIQTDRMEHSGD
jgi:peptidoglycan hydrolase-like protein with peptidoglycan-binding domain